MIKVLIKGAGDLASGIAMAFHKSGFQVLMTELDKPMVIRRKVSFASCVYEGEVDVEGVKAMLVSPENYQDALKNGKIGVVVDQEAAIIKKFNPMIVIDAILAKKNMGTKISDAPVVICCGPGFKAGEDCHIVVETKRGHYLGKLIYKGEAALNTGIPGIVEGRGLERVLYSPIPGKVKHLKRIGDLVEAGEPVLEVDGIKVAGSFKGILRGLIAEGLDVPGEMKVADIDPRLEPEYCFTISEKAMAVGRAALQGALEIGKKKNLFGVGVFE